MASKHGPHWLQKLITLRTACVRCSTKKEQCGEVTRQDQELLADGNAGGDVLIQNFGGPGMRDGGSYWDWDGGSSLFFWRWPPKVRKDVRDGTPIWVVGDLPHYMVPQ